MNTSQRDDRTDAMVTLFTDGATLAEIGQRYGVTRERVRQILAHVGVTRIEGGSHVRAQRKRDTPYLKKWGHTKAAGVEPRAQPR